MWIVFNFFFSSIIPADSSVIPVKTEIQLKSEFLNRIGRIKAVTVILQTLGGTAVVI